MRGFYRKRKIIFILLIVVGIVSLSSITYAIFTVTTSQSGTNEINTMKYLELTFSNQENNINLVNTYPMTDERGTKNTPYTFTLTNNCGTYVEYSVGLMIDNKSTLETKYVKTLLNLKDESSSPVLLTDTILGEKHNNNESYSIRTDGLSSGDHKDYELRLWLDYDASTTAANKNFKAKIIINVHPIKNADQTIVVLDLDGGSSTQTLNEIYRDGTQINLLNSTKTDKAFDNYSIVSGSGTILKNLVTNGSFENDANGWSNGIRTKVAFNTLAGEISDASSSGNRSLYINDTSTSAGYWQYQQLSLISGHQYYISAKTKAISGTLRIAIDSVSDDKSPALTLNATNSNDYILTSAIFTANHNISYLQVGSSISNVCNAYIDDLIIIDLTDSFDSIPTKSWLDENISYFEDNMFIVDNTLNDNSITLTNLVPDSSAEDGSNWTSTSSQITFSDLDKKYGSKSIHLDLADKYKEMYTEGINGKANHIYYVGYDIKTLERGDGTCYSDVGLYYDGSYHYIGGGRQAAVGIWEKKSYIITGTPSEDFTMRYSACKYSTEGNDAECFCDGFMLIDLTESFGAGNEPAKSWLDENIPYFENNINLVVLKANYKSKVVNLITNGSYEEGNIGLTLVGSKLELSNADAKFGSYSVHNNLAAQYNGVRHDSIIGKANHVYYASLWVKVISRGTGFCYFDVNFKYDNQDHYVGAAGSKNVGVWTKISKVYDTNSPDKDFTLAFEGCKNNTADNLLDCLCDGATLIDLTETFGAGNEPTKEWCDENLDWVE